MSGLFGYFDPAGELPSGTAEQMAQVMGCPADRSAVILRGSAFAIGCISKGIYPGEGEILTNRDRRRSCLYTGRLLGFSGQEGAADSISTARKVFLDDATPACLASANGPFAAAVWDENRRELDLITDRYGMYPLYAARYRSAVLYAGQIKALLAPGLLPLAWDPVAVTLMLHIGELVDDLTLLRAVRVLPAGSKVTFSSEGERAIRYWRYEFSEEETDFDGTARRLGGLLRSAVGRICTDSASVGVPLSGGLDSRALLAATPDPGVVPSFTWGLPGCRDLRYAATAARVLGSPHHAFEFDGGYLERFAPLGVWITEGQLPCTDFHVLPFVDKVAERCSLILNGFAGDAVLGGNFIKRRWWRTDSRERAGDALWKWRDIRVGPSYRAGLLGAVLKGCDIADAQAVFIRTYLDAPGGSPMDGAMAFLLDNRVRRYTSCGTSLMRWGVESDQPFLDNDFFDCVSRVPHSWRFRHRLYLRMLRTGFPETAGVQWQRTGLPARAPRWAMYLSLVLHRLARRRPFRKLVCSQQVSDFAGWMRGPLRSYVVGLLNDPRTLDRGLCDADTLRRVVRDHMEAGVDNSALLGSLLAVELFARLFVDCSTDLVNRCRVPLPPIREVGVGVRA